ncbi:MAG: transglutaminaseTgpA domain-containing protein [Acidimicrobiales bacterium]
MSLRLLRPPAPEAAPTRVGAAASTSGAGAAPPQGPDAVTGPGRQGVAAEVALAAVTAASVVGLARLFSDGSFLAPLLVIVVVAHGLAMALRRVGAGVLVYSAASGLGLLLVVGWAVEPQTLTFGLPLGDTWQAVRTDLAQAVEQFGQVRAPTATTRGFVLACALAVWTCAFTADTFAFRARARFEALVPSFVLFLFGAVLGAESYRVASAGLYLAAVLAFVILGDPARQSGRTWFAGRSRPGDRALVRAGLATAAVGVIVAVVVGPHLPGARSEGVVALNGGARGSGSRDTVSPLVDIRKRLVDQSTTELFTVQSSIDAYWRLTSLERFDGEVWSSLGSYEPAEGRLPSGVPPRATQQMVVQQVEVGALTSPWLPAAYRPQSFDGPEGVRFDPDSASLLTDEETSDRMGYSVESAVPRLTADDLAGATPGLSVDQTRRYLELPDDLPAAAREAAEEATAADPAICARLGCSAEEVSTGRLLTPYHRARALQDWFRSDFVYDLDNVNAGHSATAIGEFLSSRREYCEQFAGTYAAMARLLGLPSRVAVGFTPGTVGADGRHHVTGKEAHAWPEVYLAPTGWVAFEPTPGRAIPGGADYTGLGAPTPTGAQAAAAPPADAPTVTTVAPPGGAPATTAAPQVDPAASSGAGDDWSAWPLSTTWSVGLLLAVAYLAGVPLASRFLRSRRRFRATTPTARVLLAWSEAEEDLPRSSRITRLAETAAGDSVLAGAGPFAPAGPAMAELADQLSSAAYSPVAPDETAAARAEAIAAGVRTAVHHDVGPVGRAMWALDPRPLLAAGTRFLQNQGSTRRA